MIMHPVNLGVGVPGGEGMRGPPGITGTEDRPLLIGLLGGVNTAWLALSPVAATDIALIESGLMTVVPMLFSAPEKEIDKVFC